MLTYQNMVICMQLIYINLCIYLQGYNNVVLVYWRLNHPNEQTIEIQSDLWSLYDSIIRFPFILSREYLCKITTFSYIGCLKTALKNNQKSEREGPALLKKLKKKTCFKGIDMFVCFMSTFSNNFCHYSTGCIQ